MTRRTSTRSETDTAHAAPLSLQRPLFSHDKRWSEKRVHWRAPGETINPKEFGVEILRETNAKAFVVRNHYAGTMPPARLCVGLFRKHGVDPARLVGVAVFSVPMQRAVIPRYGGFDPSQGVELGRFVLLPEVAFNGETWFLKRAFKVLSAEKGGSCGVRCVVSYADPLARRDADGVLVKPAHQGTIYRAHNATYGGRARAETLWLTRTGTVLSRRSLSKIIHGEQGQDYATRQVLAAGADARKMFECPEAWLSRVLPTIAARVRHPGNHVFAFGLDDVARVRVASACNGGAPYPRASRVA